MRTGRGEPLRDLQVVSIRGGILMQTRQDRVVAHRDLRVVTRRSPTGEEVEGLLFASRILGHVKSNAIVLAKGHRTVGIGAGQMSRVDAVVLAAAKAGPEARGSVLASDAFFPFRDGIDEAAKAGVTAVVQAGGSIRDAEVIAAADEHNMAMAFTGVRMFKH
jgi:phosphoribosylaminoimidazolecarboxamide formyltransferase/IMP cyclohydrolase